MKQAMFTDSELRIEETVVDDTEAHSNKNSSRNAEAIWSNARVHDLTGQESQRHSGWSASLPPQNNKLVGLQRTPYNHVRRGKASG